jgi:hypothetical protein
MNLRKLFIDFVTTFFLFLVVTLVVTFLYTLIVHGQGIVDWQTAFRREIKQKEKAA